MRRKVEVDKATAQPPEKPAEPEKVPEAADPPAKPVKGRKKRSAAASKPTPEESPQAAKRPPPDKPPMDDRSSMLAERRKQIAADLEDLVLASGTSKIVERVFEVDVWATYERLEAELKIGAPGNRDRATLTDALDAAQDNARQASAIFASAKVAVERFEMDATVLAVSMREQANAELSAEKARGERPKAITDADVTSKIAALFPDEWLALEEERSRAKRTVAHLDRFADGWSKRARNLEVLLESVRG
jgi:hypothetical protein